MGKKPDKSPIGKIKLIDLPRELRSQGMPVPYHQVYLAAVSGAIPAERNDIGTRWVVDAKAIPSVIKHFSLLKKEKQNGKSKKQA